MEKYEGHQTKLSFPEVVNRILKDSSHRRKNDDDVTELLEQVQLLKEELQSKNQELQRAQNFVEKYKILRQKVSHI